MKRTCYGVILIGLIITLSAGEGRAWIVGGSSLGGGSQDAILKALLPYQSQRKLAKGMANASVYSAHVATHRGYQGYDKFAVTVGTMAAAQVPATTTDLSYYKKLPQRLRDQGDLLIGVAWNAWSANVGVKLPGGFYLSGKFGKLKYNYHEYGFDGTHAGGMLNYQIIAQKAPPVKFVLWRGLSVGTGFIWQTNTTKIDLKLSPYSIDGFTFRPIVGLYAKTESYVIPLEISTSVRLFWVINIHAGAGIDFAMGSSRLRYHSLGLITGPLSTVGIYSLYGKQGGKGSSNYIPKIFCGPGLSFGPVIIDIPFTYYFTKGFNLGVSFGVVW
ncbi:MAG: hypothetical protein JW838_05230 [Spirochaetes bacterium]|nr:hypothetical protein [Spirochaetota bacterium]